MPTKLWSDISRPILYTWDSKNLWSSKRVKMWSKQVPEEDLVTSFNSKAKPQLEKKAILLSMSRPYSKILILKSPRSIQLPL